MEFLKLNLKSLLQNLLSWISLHFPKLIPFHFNYLFQPLFVDQISSHSIHHIVENISFGDIYYFIFADCNNISKLFTPSRFIHERCIISIFTWIHVYPSLFFFNEAFSPNMICPVYHKSSLVAKWSADCCKAICPFSTPSSSSLQKFHGMIVSWKSDLNKTPIACVAFYIWCMTFRSLFSCWIQSSCSNYWIICATLWTLGLITPWKELRLKPFQKTLNLINLICNTLYFLWY